MLAGQFYALPLGDVVEVTRAVAVTAPSGDADRIVGYVDLRGELVPVISGRVALGLAPRATELDDRFVVVHASDRLTAIQVDGIAGVEEIALPIDPSTESRPGLAVTRRLTGAEGSALVTRLDVRALVPPRPTPGRTEALDS
jgi:purine-binding chemotaxis protein CheW